MICYDTELKYTLFTNLIFFEMHNSKQKKNNSEKSQKKDVKKKNCRYRVQLKITFFFGTDSSKQIKHLNFSFC